MLGRTFFHSGLRNLAIISGNLFNDIVIRRIDKTGKKVQSIEVPIAYSPKRKWVVNQEQESQRAVAVQYPRLGFAFTSFSHDPSERKTSPLNKLIGSKQVRNEKWMSYNAIPYKIGLEVYAAVKNTDDGAQIFEQIIPFFNPDFTVSTDLIPTLDYKFDIVFRLVGTNLEEVYDGDLIQRQMLVWNFQFEVDYWFFGPVEKSGIIKRATVNYKDGNTVLSRIRTTPGLTDEGKPTTVIEESIPFLDILMQDDYGFATEMIDGATKLP